MQNQTNQITQGPVAKALIRFAIPYLISSLLQALYGAVDLFVVGQYADSSAVSASCHRQSGHADHYRDHSWNIHGRNRAHRPLYRRR